ncbi:MAG: GNAT family N-acetyltransferase [Candidatus Diapherotrites archaeon]|nr:GNAT family N-acetyltransferase [Candidatus Diapherotrites archaeon]
MAEQRIRIKILSSVEEIESLTSYQQKQFLDLYNEWIDLDGVVIDSEKRRQLMIMGLGNSIKCLLFYGDSLVGFRTASINKKQIQTEVSLIHKNYRGKGLNQKMMAALEKYGRDKGYEKIIYSYMSPSMLRSFKRRARKPKFRSLEDFIKFKKQKTRDKARFAPKTKKWVETHTMKKGFVSTEVEIGRINFNIEQDFTGILGMVDLTTPKKDNRKEFHVGPDGTIIVEGHELEKINNARNIIRKFHVDPTGVARIVKGPNVLRLQQKRPR